MRGHPPLLELFVDELDRLVLDSEREAIALDDKEVGDLLNAHELPLLEVHEDLGVGIAKSLLDRLEVLLGGVLNSVHGSPEQLTNHNKAGP